MPTTVSGNYSGEASGETIPDGNNGLVPRGDSVIASGNGVTALVGNGSHNLHIFGDVFGEFI